MFYTFYSLKRIGKLFHFRAWAFGRYYLQAIVMVQMHMLGGDNYCSVVVLYIQQFIYNFALVVIVNHGNSAGNGAALSEDISHKFLADKIGYGLGAVSITLCADKSVEAPQKFTLKGNPEPGKFSGPVCYHV